jgi:organic radical activating enzyme
MNLVEVFSSVQGEGLHVGETTLFVRFGECDLRCRWCDSPHTWRPAATCRFETSRGSGVFAEQPNPVSVSEVVSAARQLEAPAHRLVSLTGGEPLLQPEAVLSLARELSRLGPAIHLETHGLAVAALEQVVGEIDVVAMDWKLASDVRRAGDAKRGPAAESYHAGHADFLRVASGAAAVFVKVVVTAASEDAELEAMAEAIARVDAKTPLVVQPVTPFGPVREGAAPQRLLELVARLSRQLATVRLIPQTHKAYGAP